VRWLVERNKPKTADSESEVSPGALYSSGLIAAGGVVGLLAIVIKLMEIRGWVAPDRFNVMGLLSIVLRRMEISGWITAVRLDLVTQSIGRLTANGWLGVAMFVLLASSLFVFARKKLE